MHLLLCSAIFASLRHYTQKGLFHYNLLHTLLELFPVTTYSILAIIIDSVHRIVKELAILELSSMPRRIRAKIRRVVERRLPIFRHDTLFRSQGTLNSSTKSGKSFQEGGIEILIQLAHVGLASLHLLSNLLSSLAFTSFTTRAWSLSCRHRWHKGAGIGNIYFLHLVTGSSLSDWFILLRDWFISLRRFSKTLLPTARHGWFPSAYDGPQQCACAVWLL